MTRLFSQSTVTPYGKSTCPSLEPFVPKVLISSLFSSKILKNRRCFSKTVKKVMFLFWLGRINMTCKWCFAEKHQKTTSLKTQSTISEVKLHAWRLQLSSAADSTRIWSFQSTTMMWSSLSTATPTGQWNWQSSWVISCPLAEIIFTESLSQSVTTISSKTQRDLEILKTTWAWVVKLLVSSVICYIRCMLLLFTVLVNSTFCTKMFWKRSRWRRIVQKF